MPRLFTRLSLAAFGVCLVLVGAAAGTMHAARASTAGSGPTAAPLAVGAFAPDHSLFLADRIGGVACVAASGVEWVPSSCDAGVLVVAVRGADGACYRPAPSPDLAADDVISLRVGERVLDVCIRTSEAASIDSIGLPIPPPRRDGVESDANCRDMTGQVFVGLDDLHRLDYDDNGIGCDEPGRRP